MKILPQGMPGSFVYGLIDPTTRLVFYIGQTSRGRQRLNEHLRKGWLFDVVILEVVDDPNAESDSLCPWLPCGRKPRRLFELERYWVALGRAFGWPLLNRTDGGEGVRVDASPSTRAKMSESHKGKRHSQESRARIASATRDKALAQWAAVYAARLAMGWDATRRARQRSMLWAAIIQIAVRREQLSARRRIDLIGQRFGMLTVSSLARCVNGRSMWTCVCDCGVTATAYAQHLKNGDTRSCGCLRAAGLLLPNRPNARTRRTLSA